MLLNLINNPSLPDLLNLCMRLLLNLSFDSELRIQMTDAHLVPPVAKIASTTDDSPQRQGRVRNFSMHFAFPKGVFYLVQYIMNELKQSCTMPSVPIEP